MAYTFDVVAWQDWNGNRYGGTPPTPEAAKGVKVLATNPADDGDTHQFWAYARSPKSAFQDFAEWWTYIGGLMVMHGLALEDEGPPSDDDRDAPYDDDWDDEDEPEDEPEPEQPTIGQRIGQFFRRIFGR